MSNETQKQDVKEEGADVLDQVRKAEKIVKTHLLMKRLADLKKLARTIHEAKEESRQLLADIGMKDEDVKRVIDFVNELPEVQLSEGDRKDIRDRVRNEGKKARREVQEKIEKSPAVFTGLTGSNMFSAVNTASSLDALNNFTTISTGGNLVMTSTDGNTLEIKV